ncbi:NAD-dependent epimerase/dehydratase family protein [Chitinophaga skermanii]|uniref:NAD-dependent epimerase/dehydratase family protein n=1 Tax=Chitinophaga skermanii TaxID=331697 RepID=A0A327QYX8_9BACT|nr:NAD-dependent epimerase/dehydratase family protein [Chitinophaga skermanii]RAJ08832.1 NAD-dependent epimerase/dehydratase family protein [Chitinophaga skermanii]
MSLQYQQPMKVIVTGATGMVGEGVLHECLQSPFIAEVLVVTRRSTGYQHPKLKELIHDDFFDISPIAAQLAGYDACYFCLGVSSVGMSQELYYKFTYLLTMQFAKAVATHSKHCTFIYVSGAGTDSSEKGRSAWARVKGKTENDLFKLPFKQCYAFRPGFIKPTPGLRYSHSLYKVLNWIFPIGRALYPKGFVTLSELGQAMINITRQGFTKKIIDGKDIALLAKLPSE